MIVLSAKTDTRSLATDILPYEWRCSRFILFCEKSGA